MTISWLWRMVWRGAEVVDIWASPWTRAAPILYMFTTRRHANWGVLINWSQTGLDFDCLCLKLVWREKATPLTLANECVQAL